MTRRIHSILSECDMEPVQLLFGCIAVIWGVWLLLPFASLPAVGRGFGYMASILSETAWGWMMIAVGLMQIVPTVIDDLPWRRAGCILATGWWTYLSVAIGLGDWHAAGCPILAFYALVQLFIALRD